MPICMVIDATHGIVRTTWTGEIRFADLQAHYRSLMSNADAMALRRSLVDARASTVLLSGEDMRTALAARVQPVLTTSHWATAILVHGDVQYGVARQFLVFAESLGTHQIFEDEALALSWLLQQNPS